MIGQAVKRRRAMLYSRSLMGRFVHLSGIPPGPVKLANGALPLRPRFEYVERRA